MAEETKYGTIWQDDDVDLIVSDYFEMLAADISGQRYVKSHHSAVLMSRIGRSHRSVEFKHQNISAVLDELGMPWIPGYKPKPNYQNAIFDAIDRYLSEHPGILEFAPQQPAIQPSPNEVFVPRPVPRVVKDVSSKRLGQLVAKFDPVERDRLNRSLGTSGESFVVDLERRLLTEASRSDLARKVRWTSQEDGDGAGYDIASFTLEGNEKLIEVKTTNGSVYTPFFLSRNEFGVANERPSEWIIYRVHHFAREPRIYKIAPPLEAVLRLATETWRASV